jgi:hypothetical protein
MTVVVLSRMKDSMSAVDAVDSVECAFRMISVLMGSTLMLMRMAMIDQYVSCDSKTKTKKKGGSDGAII